jgi:hypothetical protein
MFMKTDSIGVLADCGYKSIKGNSAETNNISNTSLNVQSSSVSANATKPALTANDIM